MTAGPRSAVSSFAVTEVRLITPATGSTWNQTTMLQSPRTLTACAHYTSVLCPRSRFKGSDCRYKGQSPPGAG